MLAQEEVRSLKHTYLDTEHLLLGLLREAEGLAARVLESLDITVERARAQVVDIAGLGEDQTPGQVPFTAHAKKALELGLREALTLRDSYVGTEHMLLRLVRVREGEGLAIRILRELGTSAEQVRHELMGMLGAPDPPAPAGARSELVLGLPDALLDGAGTPLRHLCREVEEKLGRPADAGDLFILLACVPDGFVARTLAALRVDADSLARAVEEIRRDDTRSALLPDAALMADADDLRGEAEAALKGRQFDRLAELRARERELRKQAREAVDERRQEVLGKLRERLGLSEQ